MKKREAIQHALDVMEALEVQSVERCLTNGKGPWAQTMNDISMKSVDFTETVATLREMLMSFDFVRCSHCEDPDAHENEYLDPDDPSRAGYDRSRQMARCASGNAAGAHNRTPHSWSHGCVASDPMNACLPLPSFSGKAVVPEELRRQREHVEWMRHNGTADDVALAEHRLEQLEAQYAKRINNGPMLGWLPRVREARAAGHIREYHRDIGFPEGFSIERYERNLPDILTGSKHYEERRQQKGLPQMVSADWVRAGTLITIVRQSGALLRYSVRGTWKDGYDLTVVIDAATGELVTGYFNREGDWHRLTNSVYSLPSEV